MLSGPGLSGSDRDDNESNLFSVSREVEVSNKVDLQEMAKHEKCRRNA